MTYGQRRRHPGSASKAARCAGAAAPLPPDATGAEIWGAVGTVGEPGRVGRGPRAAVGWDAPLAISGHSCCSQASVSPSCAVEREPYPESGSGARESGTARVSNSSSDSEPRVWPGFVPQFPRSAGGGA
jgi:hypothetical protein